MEHRCIILSCDLLMGLDFLVDIKGYKNSMMSHRPLIPEVMLGIRTRSFGFNGEFKRRSIFIMNHISHFDWLFFWGVVERQGDLHIWKAVTKNMMKKMPFVGERIRRVRG